MADRSYDDYLSNDPSSPRPVGTDSQSYQSQPIPPPPPPAQTYDNTPSRSNITFQSTQPYDAPRSYNETPASAIRERPSEFEASRTTSFGVTPSVMKDQDAHKWSEDVIGDINHVEVETPRSEVPRSNVLGSSDNSYTSGTGTSTEQAKQTASNAYNNASETVSNTAQAIKEKVVGPSDTTNTNTSGTGTTYDRAANTANTASEKVSSTAQSAYNSVANALPSGNTTSSNTTNTPQATSQGPTITERASNTLQSAYNAAANALPSNIMGTQGSTQTSPNNQTTVDHTRATTTRLPSQVARSSEQAGEPLEAAANPFAVERKAQLEKELLSEVPAQGSGSTNLETAKNIGSSAVQNASSAASTGFNYMKNALSNAVESANKTVESAHNAAANRAQDTQSSGTPYNANQTAGSTVGGAVHNTNIAQGAVGDHSRDTTATVPDIVKRSQAQAGYPPEASASNTANQIKQLTEQELLSEVSKDNTQSFGFNNQSIGTNTQSTGTAFPSSDMNTTSSSNTGLSGTNQTSTGLTGDSTTTSSTRPQAQTMDSEQIVKQIPGGW